MMTVTSTPEIYQLKITLKGIRPPIWRRVLVPDSCSFAELHTIIQKTMLWSDCHLHEFQVKTEKREYRLGVQEDPKGTNPFPEDLTVLQEVFSEGVKVSYTYDFGDDWVHLITFEKGVPFQEGQEYPQCIGGRRMSPPEDCGGVYGYYRLLAAIKQSADIGGRLGDLANIYRNNDFDYFDHRTITLDPADLTMEVEDDFFEELEKEVK